MQGRGREQRRRPGSIRAEDPEPGQGTLTTGPTSLSDKLSFHCTSYLLLTVCTTPNAMFLADVKIGKAKETCALIINPGDLPVPQIQQVQNEIQPLRIG